MSTQSFLTREELEAAFLALGLRARAADKIIEIAVYGGSALILTVPGRAATKDVDAVPRSRISPRTQFGIEAIFARRPESDGARSREP